MIRNAHRCIKLQEITLYIQMEIVKMNNNRDCVGEHLHVFIRISICVYVCVCAVGVGVHRGGVGERVERTTEAGLQ